MEITKKELDEIMMEEAHGSMTEDEERRFGWDGDWSKVINQYDGRR